MGTGNILIGGISFIAIAIPFVLMYRKGKETERGLVRNLKGYADSVGFQLDKWESVGNLVLGIDNKNRVAYFSEIEGGIYETRHIQLSDFLTCKVNRDIREVKHHGEKDRVTHSLEMKFYPKSSKVEVGVFPLYCEDKNRMLCGEIQLAEDWVSKYNELVK